MIKYTILLYFSFYICTASCGTSVVGTRFIINHDTRSINIKVVNDHESDYLIKSTLDDDDFFISPPLFLLNKDSSGMITIITKNNKTYKQDKIINLTITSIPKSSSDDKLSSVSMAVRNHFKVIYRHKDYNEKFSYKLKLVKEKNGCILVNQSDFAFTVSSSHNDKNHNERMFTVSPGEMIRLFNLEAGLKCNSDIRLYNTYNDVFKTLSLSSEQ